MYRTSGHYLELLASWAELEQGLEQLLLSLEHLLSLNQNFMMQSIDRKRDFVFHSSRCTLIDCQLSYLLRFFVIWEHFRVRDLRLLSTRIRDGLSDKKN